MYYIEVDELPEGVEAADVVERAKYDELQAAMNDLEDERDEFVKALSTQTARAKEAAAKYAALVLDNARADVDNGGEDGQAKPTGRTVEGLFK